MIGLDGEFYQIKAVGQLLECQIQNVRIEVDYTSNSYLELPEREDFYKAELTKENRAVLEKNKENIGRNCRKMEKAKNLFLV